MWIHNAREWILRFEFLSVKLINIAVLWTMFIDGNSGEGVWIMLIKCEIRRKGVKVVTDLKSP